MADHHVQTVILADHTQAQRDLCREILREAGCRVIQATLESKIPALARVYRPDLIILGIYCPADENIRLIRQLRDVPNTAGTPLLIVGCSAEDQDISAALDAGADEFLASPFTRKEFMLRMSFTLTVRRSQRRFRQSHTAMTSRLETMEILQQFYEQMLGNTGVEATCRRSAEAAGTLMNSDRVSILLTEPDGQNMRFAYAIGMDDVAWRDRRVPLSSPVVGRVMATRREIVVNHCTLWPSQDRYSNRQFVSLPLLRGESAQASPPLGVLNVTERRDGRDYEPQDVLALHQLAGAAAHSIDAARMRRKLDTTRDSILFSLARLSEYRHASTGRHLERVRELSLILAGQLSCDPRVSEPIDDKFISDLGRAAPLHDVGKVGIPDSILLKDGRLTPEEFAIIKNHTRIGAAALQSAVPADHDETFLKMAMDIAHCHHERYDGKGYPRGLAGDEIPLSARIVCLADCYDAIRSVREYKPARTHADASRELIQGSGTQFAPLAVDAFKQLEHQFEHIFDSQTEAYPDHGGLKNHWNSVALET